MAENAERVAQSVKLSQVAEAYNECCAQIERHNRCRQNDLRLDEKLATHDWSTRENLSLLGMCIIDSWLLYSWERGATAILTQKQFYEDLASQLIDTCLTQLVSGRALRRRLSRWGRLELRSATEWAFTSRRRGSVRMVRLPGTSTTGCSARAACASITSPVMFSRAAGRRRWGYASMRPQDRAVLL